MADGRIARGARTRLAVLDTAVALSSVYGLNAMSLARLADETGVSKSGLFAHWPDKEILQLAIIEHAVRQWTDEIVTPALAMPRGVRRLWALHVGRLAYYTSRALPGGCFFVASRAEFDDRPGPVRDALTTAIDAWWAFLQRSAEQAVELGELFARRAVLDRLRALSPTPHLLPGE
jgi:AcrR family transcriptional regulator